MARHLIFSLFLLCTVRLAAQNRLPADTLPASDTLRTIFLEEITVTARENRSAATSSFFSRAAMEHVQPFTLPDIMQLLPGGLTLEVSLHYPQYFRIRSSYSSDYSNTLGTGIWFDGARSANNANLRMGMLPGESGEYGYRGADTRSIPLGNIESVEVIRGIPSARYGDITAGAVLIRSRATREPLTFQFKATPRIKTLQASHGWATGTNSALNFFTAYTHTYADPRSRERLYRKAEAQATYSNRFRHTTLNARLSGSFEFNASKTEKDRLNGEYIRGKHNLLSANIYGSWQADRKALTSLEYRVTASYAHDDDRERRQHTQMESVGTRQMVSGEATAFFIPASYFSLARVEGMPISATASLTANLLRAGHGWQSSSSLGTEWNSEGNRGRGRMDNPDLPSALWARPYSYRDIPFLHSAILFAEHHLSLSGRAGILTAETGLRLTHAFTGSVNFPLAVEPRLNLRYTPTVTFTLKGGWGRLRKLPTLAYLFPAPAYADHLSFRYADPTTGHRLAVMSTDVVRQSNGFITLPRNDKAEAGFIARISGLEIDVTAFREHLRGGFNLADGIRPSSWRRYQNDNLPGSIPTYTSQGVTVNGQPVPYTTDSSFVQYDRTANELTQSKWGIEWVVTSERWDAIASTLIIDGAWIRTKERTGGFSCQYQGPEIAGKPYPYAAIFENADTRIYERLTTNFRLITHLPALRLVSSLSLQAVWLDRSRTRYESRYGNPVYMKDFQGNIIDGDIYTDDQHNKYIRPLYYMDTQAVIHPFTPEMGTNSRYASLSASKQPYTYLTNSYRPYFLVNLRITKEISHHTRLTFYANNIAALQPSRYSATSATYITLNPPAFYGVELQIKF